jgi:hypothetical protein
MPEEELRREMTGMAFFGWEEGYTMGNTFYCCNCTNIGMCVTKQLSFDSILFMNVTP